MRIGKGDIAHKQKSALKLIEKQGRIKVSVSMRGREKAFPEQAVEVINEFCSGLEGAKMDSAPNIQPNFVSVMVSKRK